VTFWNRDLITNLISALLLPPLNCILLCALGLILYRRHPRIGLTLSAGSLALLLIFSTVAGSHLLVQPLEARTNSLTTTNSAQAIVLLGGGRLPDAPEYGGIDMPGHHSLARIQYAARLHRQTGLPVLITGGTPGGALEAEAVIMGRVLTEDFSVPVAWLETQSNTTAENAALTAKMLLPLGKSKILLVTTAMHMPRAKAVFERSGFAVVAAPTLFLGHGNLKPANFIPGGEGMQRSHAALHEWIGLLWYRLRHGAAMDVALMSGVTK
jgi:uncharacterized SAM-binding protein YcdF (DUF218 family)